MTNPNQTLLQEASNIVDNRNEEKERQYGPATDGLRSAAIMASEMCGIELSASDVAKVLIALKFSRQAYNHKYDNLLDACAYISILNDLENGK